MTENVYFDGDPATESARRHLERVLNAPEPAPRWPWVLAALGSGAVWLLWQSGRVARGSAPESQAGKTQDPLG
jgi:hypothetical protein